MLIKIIGKYHQDEWATLEKDSNAYCGTLDTVLNFTSIGAAEKVSNIEYQTCLKTAKEFPRLESLDVSRGQHIIFIN